MFGNTLSDMYRIMMTEKFDNLIRYELTDSLSKKGIVFNSKKDLEDFARANILMVEDKQNRLIDRFYFKNKSGNELLFSIETINEKIGGDLAYSIKSTFKVIK